MSPRIIFLFPMNLTEENIAIIKEMLEQGNAQESLCDLINHIISIQNFELSTNYKTVSTKQLGFYLAKRDERYFNFEIPKKTGGIRVISAPDRLLKKMQRRIALALSLFYKPLASTTGFVNQRSIVTNASFHIEKRYLYNLDLKNFFPSIKYGRVKAVLQLSPFNASPEMSHLIAHLSCYKGVLPQGSPLSPILSNIVCQSLDRHMLKLAKYFGCQYSRYADDISLSCNRNIFKDSKFLDDVTHLIESQGFEINIKKNRLQKSYQRQEVTGIIVNRKPNLTRAYIKNVRAMLYNWDNKGFNFTSDQHKKTYLAKEIKINDKSNPAFIDVLRGKILFLGMVRGKFDIYYSSFHDKFSELLKRDEEHFR